jgi:hypothetical protein
MVDIIQVIRSKHNYLIRDLSINASFFYKNLFARELNTYTAEPESIKIAPV